jgi:hypothetical protein
MHHGFMLGREVFKFLVAVLAIFGGLLVLIVLSPVLATNDRTFVAVGVSSVLGVWLFYWTRILR